MTLPPIIERELRGAAQRPGFFWTRTLLAILASGKAYDSFARWSSSVASITAGGTLPGARVFTGADGLHELARLMVWVTLALGLMTADSISRERREGTLGLLFLTHLTAREIVTGKFAIASLTSFLALVGFLPALMLMVLAGGVSPGESVRTGLALGNALWVSLAGGLWMSTIFRERRSVVLATLGLAILTGFGAELFVGGMLGDGALPFLRLFDLAGTVALAQQPKFLVMLSARWDFIGDPLFWFSLVLLHGIGWGMLALAKATLSANWRDTAALRIETAGENPRNFTPLPATSRADESEPTPAVWPPWDRDPIRWRAEQMPSQTGLIWLAVAGGFLAHFGGWRLFFGDESAAITGLLSYSGVIGMLAAGLLLGWAGARFFMHGRRCGDLELLVVTPIGGREVLSAQWRALIESLKAPLILMTLAIAPCGLLCVVVVWTHHGNELRFYLYPFLLMVNLVLEIFALIWVGMWHGLKARNGATAVCATAATVELIPLAMLMLPILVLARFQLENSATTRWLLRQVPFEIIAMLLLMAKNTGFIVWARTKLRGELRLNLPQAA